MYLFLRGMIQICENRTQVTPVSAQNGDLHVCTNSMWASRADEDLKEIYTLSFDTDAARLID